MIVIARHINGICLNGFEYVVDENGDIFEFIDKEIAVTFMKEHGAIDEDLEYYFFKDAVSGETV